MDKATFIALIAPYAVNGQIRTGILASITIAQAALESGWGRSAPGNNLFGIKGTGQDLITREHINGHIIAIVDGFRVYDSWEGSILDHSEFLVANARYRAAGFFDQSAQLDYIGAAQALQAAGYATDPNYAGKLIAIIEANGLARFDRQAAAAADAQLHDTKEEPMHLDPWQWKMLGDSLDGLYRKRLLTDRRWAEKAYSSELTQTELAWLNVIVSAREKGIAV